MLKQTIIMAAAVLPTVLWADTRIAASCNQADVQTAVDACPADSDCTVVLPQGTAIWTTPPGQPWMTAAVLIKNKRITLQGQGIGKTSIVNGNNDDFPCLRLEGDSAIYQFRITGISFSNAPMVKPTEGIIYMGPASNWRLDHCEIKAGFGAVTAIVIAAGNGGVVDHCVLRQGSGDQKIFQMLDARQPDDIVRNDPLLVRRGHGAWQRPLGLGSADAVFIEDCEFIGVGEYPAMDIDWGSRCVFRNNNVTHTSIGSHGGEHPDVVYPDGSTYGERGLVSYEVYNSTFLGNSLGGTAIAFRGGTGVAFFNHSDGFENNFIYLACYCGCSQGAWGGGGYCKPGPYVYPFEDQVGRGPDSDGDGIRDLEPVYTWNNMVTKRPVEVEAECTEFIQAGRDYYMSQPRPGYIPYPYPHPRTLGDYAGTRALGLTVDDSHLRWNAVTGADHYVVYSDWQNPATVTTTQCPCPSGNVYYVQALDAGGAIVSAEGALAHPAKVKNPAIRAFTGVAEPLEITMYDLTVKVVYRSDVTVQPSRQLNSKQEHAWQKIKASGVYYAMIHGKTCDGKVVKVQARIAVVR
jgi:hypothetical protein